MEIFTPQEPKSDSLIGSSLICKIDMNRLTNKGVICEPDHTIANISKELDRTKDYDNITLATMYLLPFHNKDQDETPSIPEGSMNDRYLNQDRVHLT